MATKEKQTAEKDKAPKETWRKPLQVPPRTNAMRSFYQGGGEEKPEQENQPTKTATAAEDKARPVRKQPKATSKPPEKKAGRETVFAAAATPKTKQQTAAPQTDESAASELDGKKANKLTEEDLAERLGFEIDDLFDVHELLRGKSFDIYQTLMQSCEEKGRCKITQPELMKRTGIKNRRTFYKHEEWLIRLRLLEKRHLPGDHKGVVYRVLEMSDVLPLPGEMMKQFIEQLKNSE